MKCLVISDSHGRLFYARQAIERLHGKISAVFHLGDMLDDARLLEAEYEGLKFYYVAGNCDFYFSAESGMTASKLLELGGTTILIAHGHTDGVKRGYSAIARRAKNEGAQVALCGHTHEPYNKTLDGILCVNPGSISQPRGEARYPSYAVLDIPEGGAPPSAGIVSMREVRKL